MSLLTLPAELRLRIFEFLPELLPNVHRNILPHAKLTPPICRVNAILRRETLPIYATDSLFAVCIDDSPELWKHRIDCWISALGPAISRIGSLQISRHWKTLQPERWQGHVGFYIRIDHVGREPKLSEQGILPLALAGRNIDSPVVESRGLKVMTGTYPVVRDPRNMRFESIELLARVFRDYISSASAPDVNNARCGLSGDDIRFLVRAIEVLASFKMPHAMDQESHEQRRQEVLKEMESKLRAVDRTVPEEQPT